MLPLGYGQAILGGLDIWLIPQSKIYHTTCSQQICILSTLSQELSVVRNGFVVIPIPDDISGCISKSKFECFTCDFVRIYFLVTGIYFFIENISESGKSIN